MSLKEVVVEGCLFEIYESGAVNTNGVASVNSQSVVSQTTSVDSKGVYTSLKVDVSGFTSAIVANWIPASGSTTTPLGVAAPGEILASANYVTVDDSSVILEGDSAQNVTIYGKVQSGSTTVDATTVVTIKVSAAGQTVMKAE